MTINRKNTFRLHGRLADVAALFMAAALMTFTSCDCPDKEDNKNQSAAAEHQDLLIGYELLADALSGESRLDTLKFFKNLTLKSPNDAIEKMMMTISTASERRASELEEWRNRSPDVSGRPATQSPIGKAIQSGAEEKGKSEMTDRRGGFDIRFVLLQAQATRMIAVMATSIAQMDQNKERRKWLRDLAVEYEGYRMDLIKYLDAGRCPTTQ